MGFRLGTAGGPRPLRPGADQTLPFVSAVYKDPTQASAWVALELFIGRQLAEMTPSGDPPVRRLAGGVK
jgi:hypothetical protein